MTLKSVLTATKVPSPYATAAQELLEAAARAVQVMPSGLVMTRVEPSLLTATN